MKRSWIVIMLLFLVTGGAAAQDGFPRELVDDVGRKVVIHQAPQRIVSLAPSNTEILFAIGAGDQVVGVTDYCNYPAEAQQKPKVGGFSQPNLEQIIALRPDLVLGTGMHDGVMKDLDRLGLTGIIISPETVAEVFTAIERAGFAIGRDREAKALAESLRERFLAVQRDVAGKDRPRVLYQVWPDPLIVAGPGSFVDSVITLAGGENIAGDAARGYPQFSSEMVVIRDPEVILYPKTHGSAEMADFPLRPGWESLIAVKANRLYSIDGDMISRAGPRIVAAMEEVARILHPGKGDDQ
ncbi:MAG: ABC transporter substrate-binding protein [Limnochordia bacterium]|jgi:iron complex transport system substrate-binding protein